MRKGQAAMEFLMTYGWAILAVLIVIGALAYFGVIDPSVVVPDSCAFPPNFICIDFSVQNPDTVAFTLKNNNVKDISIINVDVTSNGLVSSCGQVTTLPSTYPLTMAMGAEQEFVVTGCNFTGPSSKKMKYILSINYNQVDYPSIKAVNGEILAKREG